MQAILWNSLGLLVIKVGLPLLLIIAIASAVGGWDSLARKYPDRALPVDQTFSSTSGYFGGLIGSYRMCITVGVGPSGMRLSMMALFRFLHPTIFLPWEAVTGCSIVQFLGIRRAVRIAVAGRKRPLYLYGFLWKYGDAAAYIVEYWQKRQQTGLTTEGNERRTP